MEPCIGSGPSCAPRKSDSIIDENAKPAVRRNEPSVSLRSRMARCIVASVKSAACRVADAKIAPINFASLNFILVRSAEHKFRLDKSKLGQIHYFKHGPSTIFDIIRKFLVPNQNFAQTVVGQPLSFELRHVGFDLDMDLAYSVNGVAMAVDRITCR
jgi:hypothetical protein